MKQGLNDITLLLDMTGSMQPLRQETVISCNNFIEEQKKGPGEALFTLVVFNSNVYRIIYDHVNISDAQPVNEDFYRPDGMTPLLDSLAKVIDDTGARLLAMKEEDRPEKVIIVTMTDGEENSSRHETRATVAERVKHQQEKYGWEFLFLGANMDVFAEAGSIGIRAVNTVAYVASKQGIKDAYNIASSATYSLRSDGSQTA